MKDSVVFTKVKELCNGYLDPVVYEEIYKCGLKAKEGIVVDVGPAQGGSTISLGLALTENKNLKKIYSIDAFRDSSALKSFDSIEENVNQLYSNLNEFNLKNYVTALVAGRDKFNFLNDDEEISVLFIDADGALDRDFEYYYNKLCEEAYIIFDDYREEINFWASNLYLKFVNPKCIDIFLKYHNWSSMAECTPLGKHYTIFKFVNYFINHGFIEVVKLMDDTLFARKPKNAPLFTEETKKDLVNIRKEIEKEYYDRREIMRNYYDKFNGYLPKVANLVNMDVAYLFENIYYEAKNRWLAVQVNLWGNESTKPSPVFNPTSFRHIKDMVEVLKNKKVYCRNVDDLEDVFLKKTFKQIGFKSVVSVPVFSENTFWGMMLLLSKEEAKDNIPEKEINEIIGAMVNDIEQYKSIKDDALAL